MPVLSNRWRESERAFFDIFWMNLGARLRLLKKGRRQKTRGQGMALYFVKVESSVRDEPAIRQLPRNITSYASLSSSSPLHTPPPSSFFSIVSLLIEKRTASKVVNEREKNSKRQWFNDFNSIRPSLVYLTPRLVLLQQGSQRDPVISCFVSLFIDAHRTRTRRWRRRSNIRECALVYSRLAPVLLPFSNSL